MNNSCTHEERFFENMLGLTSFIKVLVEKVSDAGHKIVNPMIIDIAMVILNNYDKNKIIENFILYSHDYWDQIFMKDERFIHENCLIIFQDLPKNHVEAFTHIFLLKNKNGEFIIDSDDKDIIWEYFSSFIKISIKYIHEKRVCVEKIVDGKMIPRWLHDYMKHINLQSEAKRWNVKLTARNN